MHTYLELEADVVDGDGVFPGEILRHSSEEGLREVEAGEPEHSWRSVIYPLDELRDYATM